MNFNPDVFLWRASQPVRQNGYRLCQYCSEKMSTRYHYYDDDLGLKSVKLDKEQLGALEEARNLPEDCIDQKLHVGFGRGTCGRCGWWYNYLISNSGGNATSVGELLTFNINDEALLLDELCSHLAKRYSDIYLVSPRRFEEAIAHIYRAMGWQVELTAQTRDGGVDLYCLSNDKGEKCIVECKRYAADRSVGIAMIDRLIGVTIRTASDSAHLVTTSSFTAPAFQAASQARKNGVTLVLTDAAELLRLLGTYSDEDLTIRDLRQIFRSG